MRIQSTVCAIAAVAASLLSSCISNEEPSNVTTETVNSGITYTVNNATGEITPLKSTSFKIETDYTQLSMGAIISSLSLPDGIVLPNAKFSGVKLTSNNTGWLIAEAAGIRPEVEGFSEATVPLFENVRIAAINHTAQLNGQTVLGAERVVRLKSGSYTSFYTPSQAWSTGYTDVTEEGKTDRFRSSYPIYLISVDAEKQLASITIHNAVFAPAMETLGLTIRFKDIPYILTANGTIRLQRNEEFIPYLVESTGNQQENETPNPGFPISDLSCAWDLLSGINISFNCNAKGATYNVRANMPFNYGTGSSDK